MALVMNFGMSKTFAFLNVSGLATVMPATMRFDYVRIYQDPDAVSVTCDPPGTETTEYIQKHRKAYDNANLTTWYVFLNFLLEEWGKERGLFLFADRLTCSLLLR